MFSLAVVHPHCTVLSADGSNERLAVRRHHDPFLGGGAERDLLGSSIGVVLPPEVKAIRQDAEEQPLPVSGPGAGQTFMARRADHSRTACARKRNYMARRDDALIIHLDSED